MKTYILPRVPERGLCKDNVKGEITMKKQGIGRKLTAVLLTLVMLLSMLPTAAFAAKGELEAGDTGLVADSFNKDDTISLPIQILDYEADGMLFEYAEANTVATGTAVGTAPTAADFGATWYEDYTTRTSEGGSIYDCNHWGNVALALKTGPYANYTHMTFAGVTTANWTGNRAGIMFADFTTSSTYTTDQLRYMVVVFRSNVRNGNFTVGLNRANLNGAGTNGNYTGNIAVTTEDDNYWTYAVLDLKTGTLGSNWSKGAVHGVYVGLPIDANGEWMDIAHVAFFKDKDCATAFGEYALTDGSDRGDNRAFGLLRGSRKQADAQDANGSKFAGIDRYAGVKDVVEMLGWAATEEDISDTATVDTIGYQLLGTFYGISTAGLIESRLSDEGYPVYKKEVVAYLADLLKATLEVEERTSDGWKEYRYIKGTASSVYGNTDLATALRTKINGNMGTYAAAAGKDLVGTWAEVSENIASYYDAAYFMLNSIFVPNSYNVPKNEDNTAQYYDYLVLSAATDSDKVAAGAKDTKTYIFDAGFTDGAESATSTVVYNNTTHTIQNSAVGGKPLFYIADNSNVTTTLNPFLPIQDDNTEAGMTKSVYYRDDGVVNGVRKQVGMDSLYKRDFGYVLTSNGEFVYHADDELFFEFEGDDDVYLFINNELVLDIGAAHGMDGYRFNLNDYVNAAKAGTLGSAERNAALALEEGQTCTFKFYYMERHSYGANLRISTNIRVTDPSMTTTKTAWQSGTALDFGSIVDKDGVVEYGFAITNTGKEKLFNLTFTDNNIGVKLDPTNGLTVTGSRVTDVNGGKLEVNDLTAVVSHPDYEDITVTFTKPADLKTFLADLTASGTEAGGGLFLNATVTIRGIGYKLSNTQISAGVFDNTVLTTAANETGSKTLQGQATMRVFVPADPMYYQWAGHTLKVAKKDLINDIRAAAATEGNLLAGKVPSLEEDGNNVTNLELVTKAGNAISSPYVTVTKSEITVNYDTAGSKVFYVKVTYSGSSKPVVVPVLINVTDVQDSVYVLDYGLKVDLTANKELTKNDAITVPGRTTNSTILGIGSNGKYSPNEITFTKDTDGVIAGKDGTFTLSGQNLTYLPNSFMEELDTIQVAMNVYEKDITPSGITGTLDINKEVEMYKNISVLPANVVYYEDCFPAITYTKQDVNDVNIFKQLGSTDNLTQSNDQDSNYGSDPSYADDVATSAGTLTTIKIDTYTPEASFTFSGTGFELIGRTNATDSATLIVSVKKGNQVVKTIPVITEFDNHNDGGTEEIYQVPVVRVKDLDYAAYTVTISGVPAYVYDAEGNRTYDEDGKPVTKTTYLYIDGLRIFQPLEDQSNYDDDEKNATFVEIRDLVVKGDAAVVDYDGSAITVNSGFTTWVEHYNDGSYSGDGAGNTVYKGGVYEGNEVTSVDDYLVKGPNNELYINGEYEDKALVFYVQDDGDANTKGRLQIAVRGIDRGLFIGAGATGVEAMLYYGVKDGNSIEWKELTTIETATEQYITVPYQECPYDEVVVNGTKVLRYQVAIKVGMPDGTGPDGMVSFSTLKCTDMTIKSIGGPAATLYYNNGILTELASSQAVSAANYPAFSALSAQMRSTEILESVPTDENGLVTAPGGNDDEGSIPVVMGRPGYEDMIAQLLAN